MLIVASVVINDCNRSLVETTPLMSPAAVPIARTVSNVSGTPKSYCIIVTADATAQRASTAPTERSIPPVMMTSVIPIAMMPFSEAKRIMFSRFRLSRKTFSPFRSGERMAARMRISRSTK